MPCHWLGVARWHVHVVSVHLVQHLRLAIAALACCMTRSEQDRITQRFALPRLPELGTDSGKLRKPRAQVDALHRHLPPQVRSPLGKRHALASAHTFAKDMRGACVKCCWSLPTTFACNRPFKCFSFDDSMFVGDVDGSVARKCTQCCRCLAPQRQRSCRAARCNTVWSRTMRCGTAACAARRALLNLFLVLL